MSFFQILWWAGMIRTPLLFLRIIAITVTDKKERVFLFLSLCAVTVSHIPQWPFSCSQDFNPTEGKTH